MKGMIVLKFLRGFVKIIFFIFVLLDAVVFVTVYIMGQNLADNYKMKPGEKLVIDSKMPVTAVISGEKAEKRSTHKIGDEFEVDLKMFGVIPFSTAKVKVVDEMYVAVLGNPFGMKIYTDGVLVVELSDVETPSGTVNPAKKAGIRTGDYIKKANGKKITCNEDIADVVEDSKGKKVKLEVMRNGKKIYFNVEPVVSKETGGYRIGIWVRDSSAGIGTLTFYSPANEMVCGLGHGICDSDTGDIMKIESGELVGAQILSVTKGKKGKPGELKGKFTFDSISGIDLNDENGVYGKLNGEINATNLTKIAFKQEVKDGSASILCTVNGNKPKLYSCEIKKRYNNDNSDNQNMEITVTDKELLTLTGGIVQGMSGSPVLQNGRLIGAITHVLVDDPTTGYAIFAENMLETAQSVANSKKLRDVS